MELIAKELDLVKKSILDGFDDPFKDSTLLDFVTGGSKYIRSTITLLYLKLLGYGVNEKVCNILAAVEILHNASLLHDDVIDEADLRRGNLTVAKKISPKISILAGDYLLSIAMDKLLNVNNKEILQVFKSCTKSMAKAEIEQFFLRGALPSIEKYLEICEGKTANLFAAALESCAFVLGFSDVKARSFGKLFGLCFQIKNDFEIYSAVIDKQNEIYTMKDILGIEKTGLLLDNYKREMFTALSEYPDNEYKKGLEEIINKL